MASFSGYPRNGAAQVIRLAGNYGEVFNRNMGDSSKLPIARGLNDLWTRGGIQHASPIR